MQQIIDTFSPLLNHFMWKVNLVHGSLIGLHFGAPHLSIIEPTYPRVTEQHLIEKFSHRQIRRRITFQYE